MLALVCTLVFAAAAAFAIAAMVVTMQGRTGQIRSLLAEYRSIKRDRAFLIHITNHQAPLPRGMATPQLRRSARRAAKAGEAAQLTKLLSSHSLRVAA